MIRALLILMLVAWNTAVAAERFPPPQFDTHRLPVTTVPVPRSEFLQYADVAVLIAALALASYLVRTRSRRSLVTLGIFSLLYFGFWRKGCVCPIGAIQNVALALGDRQYGLPWAVAAFFFLPLVSTLFFGRTFCAAVCPLGAIQDVVVLRPLSVPRWLEQPLSLLAYVYLGMAVVSAATGSVFFICQYDPFVSFFRLSGNTSILIVGACFLILGVFVARPYCRFLCPYGVLLGWLSRLSKWHATITPDECIHCRLCEDACPFGAIRKPAPEWGGVVRSAGKRGLAAVILLLPVLVLGGAGLGRLAGAPLSHANSTVRLAERIYEEDAGKVHGATVASTTFRGTGRPESELFTEALAIRGRFISRSGLLGAFVGLAIGGRLLALSIRRRSLDYVPERTTCLSCGRCYLSCPRERVRLENMGSKGWTGS